MINNNFSVSSTNWWANASARNPGISTWSPLAVRQGNNIFGQNQAATSPAFRNSIVQLSEAGRTMTQSLNNIRGTGNNASPMQALRPASGNTDAMTISASDPNRLRGIGASDFTVEIQQVAQAQRNVGTALDANARGAASEFTAGANQLSIHVGDRQFDINFNVSANASNREVQQQIANAINARSDIGVRASVTNDTAAGTSSLVLESAQTGVNNNSGQPNFTVSSNTGILAATGIDNIDQQAQNAEFRVNRGFTGALQTSRTNDVELGFGIRAQLREEGTVDVTMGRDVITQQNAFREMVNSFNDLVRTAGDAGRGSTLQNDLSNIARNFGTQLGRIGISINSEGFMRIDEARMAAAAESGELERFASRDGTNFMSRLNRTAESVSRNPAQFVQDTETSNAWNNMSNNPTDFMSAFNFTPMQSMNLARFMNLGLLFDSLI